MALWRVLDIYKRDASRRGQAPAKTTHFNSDKQVNSKPSETGRSPLNRLANRPVILLTGAYFEFLLLFFLLSVSVAFCLGRCFPVPSFFTAAKTIFQSFSSMILLHENVKKTTQNLFQPIHTFWSVYDIIVGSNLVCYSLVIRTSILSIKKWTRTSTF